MKKIYTCYTCAFPMAMEEDAVPDFCPSCSSPKSQYLVEPWNGSIENRRIHVDLPQPDPNWDKMKTSYHHPKHFTPKSRHGRIRRFVLPYDDLETTRKFFAESFDWDIVNTEHADTERPLMFCATGPGRPNWEPRFPSFGYGVLKPRESYDTNCEPRFVLEVDSIEDTLKKVVEFGGKVLKGKYQVEGQAVAVIEDSEGNPAYIWQTPDTVTWDEPESDYRSVRRLPTEF